jgi:hypothetical protein
MEDRSCLEEGYSRRGRVIWLMYFVHMYEYGALKPVQVTLREKVGEDGE